MSILVNYTKDYVFREANVVFKVTSTGSDLF